MTRSENMSRIRGTDTKPELLLQAALTDRGLVMDPHAKTPFGRPDFVDPERRIAVFVDGCYWHGCPDHYVRPRSREDFWSGRLTENVTRDRRQTKALFDAGWTVVRLWECEVRASPEAAADVVERPTSPDRWVVVRVEELNPETREERRHLERLLDPGTTRSEDGPRVTEKRRRRVRPE